MSNPIERETLETPLVCTLSQAEQAERVDDLATTLFSQATEVIERPNGYVFRFAGDDEVAAQLLAFITSERRCCAFFRFELVFEPNMGSIILVIGGAEGVKAIVEEMFVRVAPV